MDHSPYATNVLLRKIQDDQLNLFRSNTAEALCGIFRAFDGVDDVSHNADGLAPVKVDGFLRIMSSVIIDFTLDGRNFTAKYSNNGNAVDIFLDNMSTPLTGLYTPQDIVVRSRKFLLAQQAR